MEGRKEEWLQQLIYFFDVVCNRIAQFLDRVL
jgi:hypothetical protein